MTDYAKRHHPQVVARKLASGIPPINAFRADGWRQKLAALGVSLPRSATKVELYKAYRAVVSKVTPS